MNVRQSYQPANALFKTAFLCGLSVSVNEKCCVLLLLLLLLPLGQDALAKEIFNLNEFFFILVSFKKNIKLNTATRRFKVRNVQS